MLDVVKYEWENKHGAWLGPVWTTILGERTSLEDVRSVARLGRPGLAQVREIDRAPIPEEVRLTGQVRKLLSMIVLYDPKARTYTARQFVGQMVAATNRVG